MLCNKCKHREYCSTLKEEAREDNEKGYFIGCDDYVEDDDVPDGD
jgi:hypothetical protein